MLSSLKNLALGAGLLALALAAANAAPATYKIDPNHTYPSFEADHMGGLSTWRGKFNRSSGSIVLDAAASTGSVEVIVDTASIDFGHDELNAHAKGADLFDVEKYPTAVFKGTLRNFKDGKPGEAVGTLTLHGVTRPLNLAIDAFLCKPHPVDQKEVCGADATAQFNRDEFGLDYGKAYGFRMPVKLRIQVEAIRED